MFIPFIWVFFIYRLLHYHVTASHIVSFCPLNYISYDNLCYGPIESGQAKFSSAMFECYQNGGGNLTELDTLHKMVYATQNLNIYREYWIGLRDVFNRNSSEGFVWIQNNRTAVHFTNWGTLEPSDGDNDCVYIKHGSASWFWYTRQCNGSAYAFCQRGDEYHTD
ncbi:uncharacterized protein TRIADDRAFT_55988 [Trichoplax adhaerens]|uniref:C-type lectin domain-containing protein n=1 Tax=Trichoplax adhaerens TaxID=10228 RepID=B3RTN5_TRIAD|nr:hypothetical protein TRIADDRAFT_55988 [Trichoplax adhaerens]EDV26160.1 hypothetical protein TRIADDRAFT_55988 [Trichoplax adhaerens]|eukprot:XP_002112193.1 hypothetical protein TRIADDRAFT_55988 [Trichoplax adhaerens]